MSSPSWQRTKSFPASVSLKVFDRDAIRDTHVEGHAATTLHFLIEQINRLARGQAKLRQNPLDLFLRAGSTRALITSDFVILDSLIQSPNTIQSQLLSHYERSFTTNLARNRRGQSLGGERDLFSCAQGTHATPHFA